MENKNRNTAAIGVFDSGVGGLTVTREIMRQLPNENVVYFGDTARVPYGSKSKNNIIRFSRQIIRFLKTKNVKAIVIACNTASALALETVQQEFDIPIIGVIVPGARAAVRETRNCQIGVLGTEATIKSETYTKEIRKLMPEAEVIGKPCPLFVPLVEEGFAKHKITEEVIDIYLSDMRKSEIDTLILGCTHYPLLRSRIMAYFGEKVHIVNPAYETAMDLKKILEEQKIANTSGEPAAYDFYVYIAIGNRISVDVQCIIHMHRDLFILFFELDILGKDSNHHLTVWCLILCHIDLIFLEYHVGIRNSALDDLDLLVIQDPYFILDGSRDSFHQFIIDHIVLSIFLIIARRYDYLDWFTSRLIALCFNPGHILMQTGYT